MSKKFQKRVEDFVCEHCGEQVTGNGFTNHCPACLWSKHVDINPGDRAATCGGLMLPIGLLLRNGEKLIAHRCNSCGLEKLNKALPEDNEKLLLKLSATPFEFKF